jgi:glycosyltransferase involved in cell wall biosynthesis
MRVAIYTIALNEEKFIERWYESAKEADYLLIADTGSTDNTLSTAKNLGINVASIAVKPWRFDNARNAALALLPEDIDYCIALDMDEILLPGWRESLEEAHKNGLTRPRYQYTWSWKDKEETIAGLQYGGDKIHTRFGYRWKHPVHEVIVSDRLQEIQGWLDLEIHHHPDSTKSRGQYLPLLKLAVEEDPSDDRNTHYYARELFFHHQFEEAKKEFLRHLSLPRAAWKPERAASMRYIAKCSEGGEKEHWLIKAVEEAPDRREPLVDLANFYYQNKAWVKCLEYAQRALEIKEKPLEYLCEDEAWGWLPHDLASIASWHLGLLEQSLNYELEAIKYIPNDERIKNNLAFLVSWIYGEKVTAVIPTKSNFDGLKKLVESLEKDNHVSKIVIVADGNDAFDTCKKMFSSKKIVLDKVLWDEGIHAMWNIGIDYAKKEKTSVAFINDDVTFENNACGVLASVLEHDKDLGLICPDYDGRQFSSWITNVETTCRGRYDGTGGMAGFFMVMSKDLIKDWKFDESMKWWYGDDDVLNWTIQQGKKAAIVNIAKCSGNESFTINNDPPLNFNKTVENDKKIFESKWLKQ